MTDAEFYALTPRQYALLQKRHEERQKHTELQTGILASTICNFIANCSMNPPKNGLQLKPADFMPSLMTEPKKRTRRPKADNALFTARAKSLIAELREQGKVIDG